jgi:hypothetical protein
VSHHQDDGDAERGQSTIGFAVNHPREYVLIEDKTAGRFVRSHGPEQGVLVAKLHLEALKLQREAQGVGQDSIAYGDQNGCGFGQIALSFKRISLVSVLSRISPNYPRRSLPH